MAKSTLKSEECSEQDSADGQATRRDCLRTLREKGNRELPLSDAGASQANTGYGGAHCDRTDEGLPLSGPAGPAAHGLWSNSDSTFSYDLGGGWTRLIGQCALLQTDSGPVVATIVVDGKTVWESGVIKPGSVNDFDINLTGGSTLPSS